MAKLLTIEDVAEAFSCSDDQVRHHIDANELRAVNIGRGKQNRCIRVCSESVDDFLKRRTIAGPKAAPKRKASKKGSPKRDWV